MAITQICKAAAHLRVLPSSHLPHNLVVVLRAPLHLEVVLRQLSENERGVREEMGPTIFIP